MRRAGFTLLELMVVLMLLAIVSVAAIPAMLSQRTQSSSRGAATRLAALMVGERDFARERGASAAMVISPTEARYWIETARGTETGVLEVGDARIHESAARISCTFSADGTASPCAVHVAGDEQLTVNVAPWTGEVTIDASH